MNARGVSTQTQSLSGQPDLQWIRNQPKADLHLHLLGAIRPKTALELGRKYSKPFPFDDPEEFPGWFQDGDLSTFVLRFIHLFEIVRTSEDFERVAVEAFEDLAKDGVHYAEPRVTMTSHLARGVTRKTMSEALSAASRFAESSLGLEIGWVIDFPRTLGVEIGSRALEEAIAGRDWGVVGFDMAGDEPVGEEDDQLKELFQNAKESGLGVSVHAGEVGPPAHVRKAVEDLKADRIGHATRAVEDPEVVQLLAEKAVPVEICISSNRALGGLESIAEHPVETFRKAGIPVCLCTDDPSLFGTTLSGEIYDAARTFGWSKETVEEVIQNSWKHRFGPKGK